MTTAGFTPWPNEVVDDERLDELSDGAHLVYYAILGIATHRARFPGSARALCRRLRLLNAAWVERCLVELEDGGLIERYEGRGAMDAVVVVGRLVRYRDYSSLPDKRRYPSKIAEMGVDPYPPPPGVEERGWTDADRWADALPEVETAGDPKVDAAADGEEGGKSAAEPNQKRERVRGRGRGGKRARAPAREQLRLAPPVEEPPEPPPELREAVLAWEARAEELRALGHPVPRVARADLLEEAVGVPPEAFAGAVEQHLKAQPSYWASPLVCLNRRIVWQLMNTDRRAQPKRSRPEVPAPELATASHAPGTEASADMPVVAEEVVAVVPNSDWEADWSSMLARLDQDNDQVTAWDRKNWLMPLVAVGVSDAGVPVLAAPDETHAAWVEEHFRARLAARLGYEPILTTYDRARCREPTERLAEARA